MPSLHSSRYVNHHFIDKTKGTVLLKNHHFIKLQADPKFENIESNNNYSKQPNLNKKIKTIVTLSVYNYYSVEVCEYWIVKILLSSCT